MIFLKQPHDFTSKFDIVSVFIEHDAQFLLLHRQNHKAQGDSWGVPAGKADTGEDLYRAMARELFEETGIVIEPHNLAYHRAVFVRFPEYDFVYHMFSTRVSERPRVIINNSEHKDFVWVTPEKSFTMNLIQDLDACIKLHYGI